jgi:zinc protease
MFLTPKRVCVFVLYCSAMLYAIEHDNEHNNQQCGLEDQKQLSNASIKSIDTWIEQSKNLVKKEILPNGLTILFYPLAYTNQVDIRVTVNVGSRDEHEGQYGFAHATEHMIFKGTDQLSEIDIWRISERFDVHKNAFTAYDQTCFFYTTDNKNWLLFLGILADCMQNARFDENHYASELKTILSELNLHRGNTYHKILTSLFPYNHPYGHPILGTREDLVKATAQDLKRFYKKNYTPDRMIVTIVGNLDASTVFQHVKNHFGSMQQQEKQEVRYSINPTQFIQSDLIQNHITIHTQTTRASTKLCWLIPGARNKDTTIAEFIAYCMGIRLAKLVDVHDFVYTQESFPLSLFDEGLFIINLEQKTDNALAKSLAIIENEIADLMYYGPSTEELTKYKKSQKNSFAAGFEHLQFIVTILSRYNLNNNEYEEFDRYRYSQELTPSAVKQFCKKYLKNNALHIVSTVPLLETEKAEWIDIQESIDLYEKKITTHIDRQTPVEQERLGTQIPQPLPIDFDFACPDIQKTLDNGLHVYIKQRTSTPNIVMHCGIKNFSYLSLWYKQQQKGFIPSFAINLMGEESEGSIDNPEPISRRDHENFFQHLGATCYSSANKCFLQCLPEDFDIAAQRLLHIITKPTYPNEQCILHINNTIDSIQQNQESVPHRAQRIIDQHLYNQYSWNYTDEQIIEQLSTHTRQDLIDFHRTWIQPQNIYIILVGNIEPNAALEQIEAIFGAWQNANSSTLDSLVIPDIQNPSATDIYEKMTDDQVFLLAGRLSTQQDTTDAHALTLLESYLNRILFDIRQQSGLFYDCSGWLSPGSFITKGSCGIATRLMPDNLEEVKEKIRSVLADIAQNGVTQEYVDAEKQAIKTNIAKSFETTENMAAGYDFVVRNNKTFDYFLQKINAIEALTLDQINAVAREYCNPETWTFVQAGRMENNATP